MNCRKPARKQLSKPFICANNRGRRRPPFLLVPLLPNSGRAGAGARTGVALRLERHVLPDTHAGYGILVCAEGAAVIGFMRRAECASLRERRFARRREWKPLIAEFERERRRQGKPSATSARRNGCKPPCANLPQPHAALPIGAQPVWNPATGRRSSKSTVPCAHN